MSIWAAVVTVAGSLLTLAGVLFTARATTRAAQATARANQAAALAAAEPNQRAADLAAFQAIRDDLSRQVTELSQQTSKLRLLVSAFATYVGDLTAQMRSSGITPPEPPDRVAEYYRTGV